MTTTCPTCSGDLLGGWTLETKLKIERMKTTNWTTEYNNDTGPDDEGFWEWWTVTDGERSFKCDSEADAKWLCSILMANPPNDKS